MAWCRFERGMAQEGPVRDVLLESAGAHLARAAGAAGAPLVEALLALESGDVAGARARSEAIVAAEPSDAAAWLVLGEAARRSLDPTAAREAWARAGTEDPAYAALAEVLAGR